MPGIQNFRAVAQSAVGGDQRVIVSRGTVKKGKAASQAKWSKSTNARSMKEFRKALTAEYGKLTADRAVRRFGLNDSGQVSLTKKTINDTIEWAQVQGTSVKDVEELNASKTQRKRFQPIRLLANRFYDKSPSDLPRTERFGKRIFLNRHDRNTVQSMLTNARHLPDNAVIRFRQRKADAEIYGSTGKGGDKLDRVSKLVLAVRQLEVMAHELFPGDPAAQNAYLADLQKSLPAAKTIARVSRLADAYGLKGAEKERYIDQNSQMVLKDQLDTHEIKGADLVGVLERAQQRAMPQNMTKLVHTLHQKGHIPDQGRDDAINNIRIMGDHRGDAGVESGIQATVLDVIESVVNDRLRQMPNDYLENKMSYDWAMLNIKDSQGNFKPDAFNSDKVNRFAEKWLGTNSDNCMNLMKNECRADALERSSFADLLGLGDYGSGIQEADIQAFSMYCADKGKSKEFDALKALPSDALKPGPKSYASFDRFARGVSDGRLRVDQQMRDAVTKFEDSDMTPEAFALEVQAWVERTGIRQTFAQFQQDVDLAQRTS